LIAIDSAKTMGLLLMLRSMILKRQKSSAIASIVSSYKLQSANAVIGFYQSNAETTAQLLKYK
jgi:hypothetical protein